MIPAHGFRILLGNKVNLACATAKSEKYQITEKHMA